MTTDASSPRYIRAWNWNLVPFFIFFWIVNLWAFFMNKCWRAFRGPPEERHQTERIIHKFWFNNLVWIIYYSWAYAIFDVSPASVKSS